MIDGLMDPRPPHEKLQAKDISMLLTRNSYRWLLALVMAFASPYLMYWLITKGEEFGNRFGELMPPSIAMHPMLWAAFATACQAILFILLAKALQGKDRSNAAD